MIFHLNHQNSHHSMFHLAHHKQIFPEYMFCLHIASNLVDRWKCHRIPHHSCLLCVLSCWWGDKACFLHHCTHPYSQCKCVNICISIGLLGRCGFHNLQLCALTKNCVDGKQPEKHFNLQTEELLEIFLSLTISTISFTAFDLCVKFMTLTQLISPTSTIFLPITDFICRQTPPIHRTLDVPISTSPICAVHLCTESTIDKLMTHLGQMHTGTWKFFWLSRVYLHWHVFSSAFLTLHWQWMIWRQSSAKGASATVQFAAEKHKTKWNKKHNIF